MRLAECLAFCCDEVLRDRLKEAKGIGTPATRAEIHRRRRSRVSDCPGKNIVPTEAAFIVRAFSNKRSGAS